MRVFIRTYSKAIAIGVSLILIFFGVVSLSILIGLDYTKPGSEGFGQVLFGWGLFLISVGFRKLLDTYEQSRENEVSLTGWKSACDAGELLAVVMMIVGAFHSLTF